MTTTTNLTRKHQAVRCSLRRGLTLIELLCFVSVAVATLGASIPGLRDITVNQRLQAVTSILETEVQLAKSLAAAQGQTVRLAIEPIAGGTCMLIHTGPRRGCECDAQGNAICTSASTVMHVRLHDAATGVRVTSVRQSIAFSADRGTVTPTATIKLADERGRALHQVVNVMGRTRTCSPQGEVAGFAAC